MRFRENNTNNLHKSVFVFVSPGCTNALLFSWRVLEGIRPTSPSETASDRAWTTNIKPLGKVPVVKSKTFEKEKNNNKNKLKKIIMLRT